MMRVEVDEFRCVSAGQCVLAAPEVFDQRADDGIAVVLTPEPVPQQYGAVREAEAMCPAKAILLTAR